MREAKQQKMSKLILMIACIFLNSTLATGQNIYTYSVTTIEGTNKPLNAYTGKKIFIITLPTQQNNANDSLLRSLDSIRAAYATMVQIIAVPAYEDGYTLALKPQLKLWYRSKLGMGIIVTEGMYTRKTSGTQQHALLKWLTDKTKNGHFDQDVTGAKNKFMVWTDGELVAVLAAQTKIRSTVINDLLQGQ
jgi:glutathione peroxidase